MKVSMETENLTYIRIKSNSMIVRYGIFGVVNDFLDVFLFSSTTASLASTRGGGGFI